MRRRGEAEVRHRAPRGTTADPEPAPDAASDTASDTGSDAGSDTETEAVETATAQPPAAPPRRLIVRSPFAIGFYGAVGALLAFWLAQQIVKASSVLILVMVSLFLAFGLNPAVEFLMRRRLRRPWAVLVVALCVLIALTLFIVSIAPVITEQVAALTRSAPGWFDQLQHNRQIQQLDAKYDLVDKVQHYVTSGQITERLFGGALGVGLALLSALGNAFVITVLTLYFLASLPQIKRSIYRLAPASKRARVTVLGEEILGGIGGYVSGAFVVAVCAALSTLLFLFIIGMGQYAVALAFVVGLLDVIPMIGATIGAVIVSAIGFATDIQSGIALVIFYVVYQQLENYFIYPRVMSRSVDVPGAVTVVAALIGASLLGVVGALLAIPTAAAILLLVREVVVRRQDAR